MVLPGIRPTVLGTIVIEVVVVVCAVRCAGPVYGSRLPLRGSCGGLSSVRLRAANWNFAFRGGAAVVYRRAACGRGLCIQIHATGLASMCIAMGFALIAAMGSASPLWASQLLCEFNSRNSRILLHIGTAATVSLRLAAAAKNMSQIGSAPSADQTHGPHFAQRIIAPRTALGNRNPTSGRSKGSASCRTAEAAPGLQSFRSR